MNHQDLEQLVRESLRTRADDVEATTALWDEVEQRAGRRRWRTRFAWMGGALAAAAIAVLAVIVVPTLLPDDDVPTILDPPDEMEEPEPEPDEEPADDPVEDDVEGDDTQVAEFEEDPNLPPGLPQTYVSTDGTAIYLRATGSDAELARVEVAASGERVTSVAVRPGSSPQDLTVAFHVATQGGGHDLRYLTVRDGTASLASFADHGGQYDVSDDAAPGAQPRPVWSPDGGSVAWIELPADETAAGPRLRMIGWDEGPGTGDTATDNTSFELDDVPLTAAGADAWAIFGEPGMPTDRTAIFLTSGELEAWNVVLEQQGDGAYAYVTTNLLEHPAGTALAFAPDMTPDGPRPAFAAVAVDECPGVRVAISDDTGHQQLPVEEGMSTAEPAAVWVAGTADHVLVGDGERAWITSRPGGLQRALQSAVVHADWVQ